MQETIKQDKQKKEKKQNLGGYAIGVRLTDNQIKFLNDHCEKNTISYSTVIRQLINSMMKDSGYKDENS